MVEDLVAKRSLIKGIGVLTILDWAAHLVVRKKIVQLIFNQCQFVEYEVLLALDVVKVFDVLSVLAHDTSRLRLDLLDCFYLSQKLKFILLKLLRTFFKLLLVS